MEFDYNKGQHLLVDKEVLKKEIKEAELDTNDKVLEIGAGRGFLTKELVEKAGKVTSFEIDRKFERELKEIQKENDNLRLVFDNALDYSWKGYDKIIANIPYFLSELILNKAMFSEINFMVLIVGEKFKNLLLSDEKLGRIARKFYNIIPISEISPDSFDPEPRVNSYLIRFVKKKEINKKDKIIISICLSKGKIKNAILKALVKFGKTKNSAREIIKKMNLDKKILEKQVLEIDGRLVEELEKVISNGN